MGQLLKTLTTGGPLDGKKSHLLGLAMIAVGLAKTVWPELPIEADPTMLIGNGFAVVFLRQGISKIGKDPT